MYLNAMNVFEPKTENFVSRYLNRSISWNAGHLNSFKYYDYNNNVMLMSKRSKRSQFKYKTVSQQILIDIECTPHADPTKFLVRLYWPGFDFLLAPLHCCMLDSVWRDARTIAFEHHLWFASASFISIYLVGYLSYLHLSPEMFIHQSIRKSSSG